MALPQSFPSPRDEFYNHHSRDHPILGHQQHHRKLKPSTTYSHKPPLSSAWSASGATRVYTSGQVVLFVLLGTSVAVMVTVLVAVHAFTNSLAAHFGTLNATTWMAATSSVSATSRNLRSDAGVDASLPPALDGTFARMELDRLGEAASMQKASTGDNPSPNLIWLMSFPNSGTSFTIHMTREATNCTTATNYGLEGEIRDKPSVPAIQGPAGVNGPWLELLPHRTTRIAETILVKTHCKGFCSGSFCGAEKTFHTTRSFMIGCLTGNQGIATAKGMRLVDKTYDKSLVKKAIHIFRNPLDNVVARFHLEYNEKSMAGDSRYTSTFSKDATGFRKWCALDNRNRGLVQSHYIDPRLRGLMLQIPCFNEFYRYTQWHNLAFETTRAMNLTTMLLHYHEFSDNFEAARGRILDFLELPLVGEGIEFDDGKEYGNYYSHRERLAIVGFLREFASTETREQLEHYDFQTDEATGASET
jgi:hypothetical protein